MYEYITYPNDLSNKEWKILEPLIPVYDKGARRKVNMRDVLNGLFYITRTGCQWDYVPKDKLQLNLFSTPVFKVSREDELRRFKIVKWRWIVERTISWLTKNRRLRAHPTIEI
ncbi:MAG: transposase [Spirochaetota bacterium]|nr:transposase [Spirochaetota bacterium]